MIIREMPIDERPREKMQKRGSSFLSNSELLAILLRTGTKEKTAVRLADDILSLDKNGIIFLSECSLEDISKVKGVGLAKACQIMAAVELGKRIATLPRAPKAKVCSTEDVVSIFMERMRYHRKEFFNQLLINAKGEIIGEENIAIGDLCSSVVHPRESFSVAVKKSAAAVIFVHNHPSGDPSPSPEDVNVTKRLCQAGEILGIKVLDHIIIGDGKYISLKAEGLI